MLTIWWLSISKVKRVFGAKISIAKVPFGVKIILRCPRCVCAREIKGKVVVKHLLKAMHKLMWGSIHRKIANLHPASQNISTTLHACNFIRSFSSFIQCYWFLSKLIWKHDRVCVAAQPNLQNRNEILSMAAFSASTCIHCYVNRMERTEMEWEVGTRSTHAKIGRVHNECGV